MVSRSSKSLGSTMEPWSYVDLDFEFLKRFIVLIKSGNLNELKSIFDSKEFRPDQKHALLTKCFNTKDFNPKSAFVVTNAISLAKKYDNKAVLEYLQQQKSRYVSSLSENVPKISEKSFLSPKKSEDDVKPIKNAPTSSKS